MFGLNYVKIGLMNVLDRTHEFNSCCKKILKLILILLLGFYFINIILYNHVLANLRRDIDTLGLNCMVNFVN